MKRALDLFCGAGGATRGLQLAGYRVTGVDIAPQPHYVGDEFVQGDAVEYARTHDLLEFDLLWASPPCQRWSDSTKSLGDSEAWPDLIVPIREIFRSTPRPWVMENVPRAPLVNPIILCGAMFGLDVIRHRAFESSPRMVQPQHPKHKGSIVGGRYVTVTGHGGVPQWALNEREKRGLPRKSPGEGSLSHWKKAMGIDWMSRNELVEAIPPAYSKLIAFKLTPVTSK